MTFLATVPTVMQRLLPVYRADPDAFDLSSIRVFWHLAAPCPPAVKQAWIELLGPEAVWELYTGTELQAVTFITGDQWLTHRGSVGPVVVGEMKVLDDDGRECAPGEVGEIYLRPTPGDAPTYRYVGATAKTRDGWDSLGDLGYFDEDGYLYLSDRRVDMFTVGGRNVYPAEIESALSAHPDVLSCLVVGVPHEDLGQVPYALVQAARSPEAAALDEAAVTEFLRERVAGYKVPRTVEFVDSPLRDDAGKARRSAVRAEIIARLQARASPLTELSNMGIRCDLRYSQRRRTWLGRWSYGLFVWNLAALAMVFPRLRMRPLSTRTPWSMSTRAWSRRVGCRR